MIFEHRWLPRNLQKTGYAQSLQKSWDSDQGLHWPVFSCSSQSPHPRHPQLPGHIQCLWTGMWCGLHSKCPPRCLPPPSQWIWPISRRPWGRTCNQSTSCSMDYILAAWKETGVEFKFAMNTGTADYLGESRLGGARQASHYWGVGLST